jgi:hypothetical protein
VTPQRVAANRTAASRWRQLLAVAAAFALGASLTGGIAVAVQSSPRVLHACANAKGVLSLPSPSGHCAAKLRKVTLNRPGPRGIAGTRGARGGVGRPGGKGLLGSHAKSSVAANTTGTNKPAKGVLVSVDGSAIHVQAQCVAGRSATITIRGADRYVVYGYSHFTVGDQASATADHETGAGVMNHDPIQVGARVIDYGNNYANAKSSSDINVRLGRIGEGTMSANLLAAVGNTTFTIAVYLHASNDPSSICRATAQVTAAS